MTEQSKGMRIFSLLKGGLLLIVGGALIYNGYLIWTISANNETIRETSLKELYETPPDSPLWVRIEGSLLPDSAITAKGAFFETDKQYILLTDSERKRAILVQLADGSTYSGPRKPDHQLSYSGGPGKGKQ